MERKFIGGTWQVDRAFSPAVVTQGGRTVWLAGHGATTDSQGNPLGNDFEAQTRRSFEYLSETLAQAGGTLADIVTMTVYIIDARFGDDFIRIRKDYFPDGNFPGSALITIAGFAKTDMMVEIQGIAVIDD